MFGIAIPIIALTIWNYSFNEGIYIMQATKELKFNFATLLPDRNPDFWSMLSYFSLFAGVIPHIHKSLIGKKGSQKAT